MRVSQNNAMENAAVLSQFRLSLSLLASKHKIANLVNPLNIKLGDETIKRVTMSKSLGMYLDEDLSWNEHVDYIARKISSAVGGLKQVRPFVTQETLLTIYKSIILPHFDYCDVFGILLTKVTSKDFKSSKTLQLEL